MSELDRGRLAERTPRRAEHAPGGETRGTEPARPTGMMPSQPPTSPRTRKRKRRSPSSRPAAKVRATWVTHGLFGLVVTPRRWTTRRSASITNRT